MSQKGPPTRMVPPQPPTINPILSPKPKNGTPKPPQPGGRRRKSHRRKSHRRKSHRRKSHRRS